MVDGEESREEIFIYFKQYLVRGAQFSEAGWNAALIKKEKMTHKTENKKWYNSV